MPACPIVAFLPKSVHDENGSGRHTFRHVTGRDTRLSGSLVTHRPAWPAQRAVTASSHGETPVVCHKYLAHAAVRLANCGHIFWLVGNHLATVGFIHVWATRSWLRANNVTTLNNAPLCELSFPNPIEVRSCAKCAGFLCDV